MEKLQENNAERTRRRPKIPTEIVFRLAVYVLEGGFITSGFALRIIVLFQCFNHNFLMEGF
jgi:hypothetical protein